MSDLPEKVYHGTDARSAKSIRQNGLDEAEWEAAGGSGINDDKGFSVTTDRATAEEWARYRAIERGGPPEGVVLEADSSTLPLHEGGPDQWSDLDEFFILPKDFPRVGPGVFR